MHKGLFAKLAHEILFCLNLNQLDKARKKTNNLNLPFGQASLKFKLPEQYFINCYFRLVHEQLVHILAHWASEWVKLFAQHKNLLVVDDWAALFSSSDQAYHLHNYFLC